ncbi:MAG: amino acid permease [Acidobacteria bacterium]|nr:MAG: amino acid permease [Acidobacteriota bacterium]
MSTDPPTGPPRLEAGDPDRQLVRAIGLGGATLLVVGNVVGSAIFLTTGIMARQMPSATLLLLAWSAGGLIALAGGLTCAEMAAMYPRSGGWYVFLVEAYGPLWGFLFGWAGMLVMLTGSLAAVAVGFAEYFSYFFPTLSTARTVVEIPLPFGRFEISAGQLVATASIALLGAVNYFGVQAGNAVQSALTVLKVAALAAVPALALAVPRVRPDFASGLAGVPNPLGAFGVSMIAVMWAYSGWDYVSFASGEVRDPKRNLPRALVIGISTVTILYVCVNLGYLYALRVDEMKGVARVAEHAVTALVGAGGAAGAAAAVMISTLGCNASGILPISRVCYALSRDGLFLKSAARVHPRYRTPHVAVAWTCAWAALLALSGTYEELYTYVTFTGLLFNVAGGAAIFRLRRTKPDWPRPYRAWGYPLVPAIFVGSTAILLANTLVERPRESILGTLIVALGLPLYAYRRRTPGATKPGL